MLPVHHQIAVQRERRTRLRVDTQRRLLAREGYAALSTRRVAAAIGYTVGTLYLLFRNFDELILQVNARTLDALSARLARAENEPEGTSRVLALGQAYLRFATERPQLWRMVFEHRMSAGAALPDWYRERVARLFGLIEAALRPLLSDRPQAQLITAARVIWTGVHGICLLEVTERLQAVGSPPGETLVESLIVEYLRGLRTPAHS
jgi:AcrR family transcriptional regulator